MKKLILLLFVQIVMSVAVLAGNGKIAGKVIDKTTGEPLIGVNVVIAGTTTGAATDLDGHYSINVAAGSYTLQVSFISYNTQKIEAVKVEEGKTTNLNIVLEEASNSLQEVEIVATFKRESHDALVLERRKSAVISDGVSAELIRKTPDRSTSDVLRRVSGASIQDNKFAIIRGLNERYNSAYLNGAPLLSTEPDRKAFAFDIFPANLIESVVIAKTATPDLPADFAGGAIQVKTKDIPDENFYSLSVGSNFHSQTTFKPFYGSQRGKTDWLGLDDGTRAMPKEMPSTADFRKMVENWQNDDINALAGKFENTWKPNKYSAMRPGSSFQFSAGHQFGKFGSMASVSYYDNYRYRQTKRTDYANTDKLIDYTNDQYTRTLLTGVLWNLSYKVDDNNKISLKNLYNINTSDQTTTRKGYDYGDGYYRESTMFWYTQNQLLSNQLTGEHYFSGTKIKANWNVGYNDSRRNVPDLRRITYQRSIDNPTEALKMSLSNSAQADFGGRFYSKLNETSWSYSGDVSVPVYQNISVKTGLYRQARTRKFDARQLGYIQGDNYAAYHEKYLSYAIDSIFAIKNIQEKGITISESTTLADHYDATSTLNAAFVMTDATVGKFRFIGGVRMESYNQTFVSYKTGDSNPDLAPSVNLDNTLTDWLPSLNVVYSLTQKSNLRASVSQTVSRPEFRELAPFQFYDFNDVMMIAGNPNIKRTKINNVDLRYEYYPGAGQVLSASVFYKHFDNPIEKTLTPAGSFRLSSYVNVPTAVNYGVELDIRQNLVRIDPTVKIFERLTVFGNLSLIKSSVDLKNLQAQTGESSRPMQGQSSYIVNGGINYSDEEHLFDINLSVNRVGRRINNVGNADYASLWENPRTIIDMQFSKSFTNKMEVKINCGDLLAQRLLLYQDNDKNGKLNRDKDNVLFDTRMGRSISVAFSYKF